MMFRKGALYKSSARKVKESRRHQEAKQAASYEPMLPLLGSGLVQDRLYDTKCGLQLCKNDSLRGSRSTLTEREFDVRKWPENGRKNKPFSS